MFDFHSSGRLGVPYMAWDLLTCLTSSKRIFGGWYYACCSRQQQERTAGLPKTKKLWNPIVPLKNRLDRVRSLVHSLWYEQTSLTLADCDEPVRCLMLVMFVRWCGAHGRTLLLNCSVSIRWKTHERPLERWSRPIRLLLFCYFNQVARGWDFLLLPIAVLSSRRLRFEEMKKLIIN